ncbi:hypothetical protein NC653_030789 [Populus alba x Populus x berolinensis]|uniref:Uncharacterized protein n=2 Tax=Populus TaxID=3689 RepID=A0A4U5MPS0_POPAL|nr:hypothetical protein NC653_030789 [Populus alba x Populus x berolinensis]TKR71292.1 uncharacterized protein D5086_0000302030 [Populus alba]
MHRVQASDTADQQAALETNFSRNWNLPRKLKVAYPPENMRGNDKYYTAERLKGIKIMLSLDSDRQSGTVKIASTEHFSAEVNAEPERRLGTPKPSSPIPSPLHHYGTPPRNEGHKFSPPPPMSLYCQSCR